MGLVRGEVRALAIVAVAAVGVTSVRGPAAGGGDGALGFGWGGRWLVPDGAHFEYLRPPAP